MTEVTEKLAELPLGQMLAELDSSAQGLTTARRSIVMAAGFRRTSGLREIALQGANLDGPKLGD